MGGRGGKDRAVAWKGRIGGVHKGSAWKSEHEMLPVLGHKPEHAEGLQHGRGAVPFLQPFMQGIDPTEVQQVKGSPLFTRVANSSNNKKAKLGQSLSAVPVSKCMHVA